MERPERVAGAAPEAAARLGVSPATLLYPLMGPLAVPAAAHPAGSRVPRPAIPYLDPSRPEEASMTKRIRSSRSLARSPAVVGLVFLCLVGFALAASGPDSREAKPNRYIGAAKCKNCHTFEAGGNQYGAWQEAKHASAFEVLASDEAHQVAADLGIADPQKSDRCLKCHVTGHGEPEELFKNGFDVTQGVQCETCHGPGEEHLRARFRAAAQEEDLAEGQVAEYVKVPEGEIITTPTKEVCYGCHNEESPSFKNFCFYERIAKIRHLDPRKPRTEEERAKLLICGCGDSCGCVHECPEGDCGIPPKE